MKIHTVLLAPFATILILLAIAAFACSVAPRRTICSHPAIMGGMPFIVPAPSHFSTAGGLHFRGPDKRPVSLYGAVCVVESAPASE